jgi:hypothetical protein
MNTLQRSIARLLGFSNLIEAANPRERYTRPHEPLTAGPMIEELSPWDLRILRSDSRKLYYNLGPVKGAVDDRATYAIGSAWIPRFTGTDLAWGDTAKDWLVNSFYPLAYLDGGTFQDGLHQQSVWTDVDGDIFLLLTEREDGFPAAQLIMSHQIGQRDDGKTIVGPDDAFSYFRDEETGKTTKRRGAYRGLRIIDGIIINAVGTPVAARILGDSPAEDRDESLRSLIPIRDIDRPDQLRGIPGFTHAILDLKDLRRTQGYEREACALCSSIGIIEHNELGGPDLNDPGTALRLKGTGGATNEPGLVTKEYMGGLWKYIRANSGGKLETMKNDRPGEDWEKFMDRLIRNAMTGLGWPYELAWKLDVGGNPSRVIVAKGERAIADRQALLCPPNRRLVGYALRKAINLGILPDSPDWWKWSFTYPGRLTGDYGRDKAQDREDYFAGITNMTEIVESKGKSLKDHIKERQTEDAALAAAGITPQRAQKPQEAAV